MALTPHQKKFKKASSESRRKCHKSTTTPEAYGKCFGKEMSKALKGKGKKKKTKTQAAISAKCVGITKSGPNRGKVKKGFKFAKGKKCPVKR